MADRTSAGLFGKIFTLLAKNPSEENKKIAREIYKETLDYDFSMCQMYVDDELMLLGLAKIGIDPEYPEEGEVIIYNEAN